MKNIILALVFVSVIVLVIIMITKPVKADLKLCGVGTHVDPNDSSKCNKCGIGTYADKTNSSECKSCGKGTWSDEGASKCENMCKNMVGEGVVKWPDASASRIRPIVAGVSVNDITTVSDSISGGCVNQLRVDSGCNSAKTNDLQPYYGGTGRFEGQPKTYSHILNDLSAWATNNTTNSNNTVIYPNACCAKEIDPNAMLYGSPCILERI